MSTSTAASETRPPLRRRLCGALLLAVSLAAHGPAASGNGNIFLGQIVVEDAREETRSARPLHYRIDHVDPDLLLSQLAGWIDTAERRGNRVSIRLSAYPVAQTPAADDRHLASSFLIDYREPAVRELAGRIESRFGPRPSPGELEAFVHDHIEHKNLAHGFDVASNVAQSRAGDCTEHAVLLTALLRMYGYPARTVLGVFVSLQQPVTGFGHAWSEYRSDRGWIGIDGTRIDDSVGARYLPLVVVRDESIAYRLAIVGMLRSLGIERITVE